MIKKIAGLLLLLSFIGSFFVGAYNTDYEVGYNRGYRDAQHQWFNNAPYGESPDYYRGYNDGQNDEQNDSQN